MTDTAKAVGIKSSLTSHPYYFVIERLEKMTPEEFRRSLVRAGIANEDGTLTAKYRRRR
jgi:hypothetical protein